MRIGLHEGKVILWRRYEVEAAHQLTEGLPENHKCRRLHGHRYVISIGVEGELAGDGMVIEYADLDTQVRPVLNRIDHHSLNTLHERHSHKSALAVSHNPTVELLCLWLVEALGFLRADTSRLYLVGVKVEEDSTSSVEWRG